MRVTEQTNNGTEVVFGDLTFFMTKVIYTNWRSNMLTDVNNTQALSRLIIASTSSDMKCNSTHPKPTLTVVNCFDGE